ncbi:MAG: hypothetical protein R3C24_18550 [Cyanobacteriota/Melainabacteria group bacterium]
MELAQAKANELERAASQKEQPGRRIGSQSGSQMSGRGDFKSHGTNLYVRSYR